MAKIGLITCQNSTQAMGCSSILCLKDMREESGEFSRYSDDGGVELIGVISCAGCPTLVASERLINRVRILVETGAQAIHLSNCIMALCPFKNKYLTILEDAFPGVDFIMGTHIEPVKRGEEMFRQVSKEVLCQQQLTMADIIKRAPAELLNQ